MTSKMYAIIKSGGKQYRIEQDDIIEVELLNADVGDQVEFGEILFVSDGQKAHVGGPSLPGYHVKGELLGMAHGPKITSMKYKPSHHQYRRFGHKQHYSRVRITEIAKHHKTEKHHGT